MNSDEEFEEGLKKIARLQEKGHALHCAFRQVWGDGYCECDLYKKWYNPYRWMERKEKS